MSTRTRTATVTETQTITLGEAAPGRVGRWAIQYEGLGSDNWDIAVQSQSVADSSLAYTPKGFFDLVAGATTTTQPASGTATSGHILVDSTGQQVRLAITVTGGSLKIAAAAVEG